MSIRRDVCARCCYSLTGLPARHRCPECGLPYDEHSQVWLAGRNPAWYVVLVAQVLITVNAVWDAWLAPLARGAPPNLTGSVFAVGMLLVLAALTHATFRYRRGLWAAITPAGVISYTTENLSEFPWLEVFAEPRPAADQPPEFSRAFRKHLSHLRDEVFVTRRRRGEFEQALRAAAEHYRAAD